MSSITAKFLKQDLIETKADLTDLVFPLDDADVKAILITIIDGVDKLALRAKSETDRLEARISKLEDRVHP